MAYLNNLIASSAIILLTLHRTALGDGICNDIVCGKGTCELDSSYLPFGYKCECDSGWRRTTLPDSQEQFLEFLPCIIPECSINYSCIPAAAPAPPPPTNPQNSSTYDPCYAIYCGDGTCKKASKYVHKCQCQSGAYNLLNVPQYPCYNDCAIGSDCSKLGIKPSNSSASPAGSPDSGSDASADSPAGSPHSSTTGSPDSSTNVDSPGGSPGPSTTATAGSENHASLTFPSGNLSWTVASLMLFIAMTVHN